MASLSDLMAREVITIEPSDTIGHAAEKMVQHGVSAIVVSASPYGRLLGIITERDLTRAVAGRVHTSEARVREWMTADPKTVSESTDPVEAVKIMLDGGFRHIPIVENERAIGIVSIRDLAEWSITAQPAEKT
jgi:CBS domain-containing protein